MKILTYQDDRLRVRCKEIVAITPHVTEEATALLQTLKQIQKPWMIINGIAANQVGITNRIVILKRLGNNYVTMINPQMHAKALLCPSLERCFSLPGILRFKRRHFFIVVKYQDIKGSWCRVLLLGPTAFTMQQEIDHLDGKLIID